MYFEICCGESCGVVAVQQGNSREIDKLQVRNWAMSLTCSSGTPISAPHITSVGINSSVAIILPSGQGFDMTRRL
jgi:hypothetical protein